LYNTVRHGSTPEEDGRRAQPARAPKRRPQQRSVDTRDALVDAALQEFATHGFDGATTREIARRAGVALAALPYHFTTKEALWRAAADRIFALLSETFRARFSGLEGVDLTTRLRLILRDFVRFAAAHPELHRFMVQEGMRQSPRLRGSSRPTCARCTTRCARWIEAAQREGMAPIGRPEHLHYMLIGAASSAYALSAEFELLTGEPANQEALVAEHVAALERMFFPTD
jgi:AcrR family transcriptional regulator